jgi:uncharacterized surface protein with fasciclin (FAS1) repeats
MLFRSLVAVALMLTLVSTSSADTKRRHVRMTATRSTCSSTCSTSKSAGHAVMTSLPVHQAASDIVDTAVAAGSFKTLVAAVKAAGLVETLKGKGPFTVFAPTDEAFAKLPAGTVESLLKPENKDKLVAILTYHVVPGSLKAGDVVKAGELKTVNGKTVKITTDGGAKINGAGIVKTDIETSNGIIHVIDAVILP